MRVWARFGRQRGNRVGLVDPNVEAHDVRGRRRSRVFAALAIAADSSRAGGRAGDGEGLNPAAVVERERQRVELNKRVKRGGGARTRTQ